MLCGLKAVRSRAWPGHLLRAILAVAITISDGMPQRDAAASVLSLTTRASSSCPGCGSNIWRRISWAGWRRGSPTTGSRCMFIRFTSWRRSRTDQRLNLYHAQNRCQLTMLVRQRTQLLIERRKQNALHDPLELIQYPGNGKLHRVGTPSTLDLVLVTLF